MSCYIVNKKTIDVIVKGIEDYGIDYRAKNYKTDNCRLIVLRGSQNDAIGQSLLNQNYASVDYRYRENNKVPEYHFSDVEYNEGMLLGCINCYLYQACETEDFFESELYRSLRRLKEAMLEQLIEDKGQDIPWGVD